jgi:prepilin-type processing-associated H-X9-DG protein
MAFGQDALAYNVPPCTSYNGCSVARGDYQVNSGSIGARDIGGPQVSGTPPLYPKRKASFEQNGISHQYSMVQASEVTDGTSKTFMLGEKCRDPDTYYTGTDPADNQCVFSGHDSDNNGYTGTISDSDGQRQIFRPRQDEAGRTAHHYFGSAHNEGLHMAYCDGSVQYLLYEIDSWLWYRAGGRNDELP